MRTRLRLLGAVVALALPAAACGGGDDELSTDEVVELVTEDTRARFESGPASLTRLDVECEDAGEDLWRCESDAQIEAPGTEPVETSVEFRVRCTEADGCTFLDREP